MFLDTVYKSSPCKALVSIGILAKAFQSQETKEPLCPLCVLITLWWGSVVDLKVCLLVAMVTTEITTSIGDIIKGL